MSQEQPQREPEVHPTTAQEETHVNRPAGSEPVKYGDVFPVAGDLASEPIRPQDAAMMQAAEGTVLGRTQKGGPAAVMQAAATWNERAGLVGHGDVGPLPADSGVAVAETNLPGRRVITESVGGQVVGQYEVPAPVPTGGLDAVGADTTKLTIGEALEAAAATLGEKPVERSDAAAIQAAERRATGMSKTLPGGVAAAAQAAAAANTRAMREEDKVKLGDVLKDATEKLPLDKEASPEDVAKVAAAELRNSPSVATQPGGVAASVAAAARLNERAAGST